MQGDIKITPRLSKRARRLGFKTQEEYIVFSALKKKRLNVQHNVRMAGTEIDLFIPPKIIIEIGYRDEYLMEKWDDFTEKGYEFIYFSNVEVNDLDLLKRRVDTITRLVEETYVNCHRWNVMGFSRPHQKKDSICYNETTDDGLKGVLACLELALREGAIEVNVTRMTDLKEKAQADVSYITSEPISRACTNPSSSRARDVRDLC